MDEEPIFTLKDKSLVSPEDPIGRLDQLIEQLSDNPASWKEEIEPLTQLRRETSLDKQTLFVQRLINGVFAKIGQHEQAINFLLSDFSPSSGLPLTEAYLHWKARESFFSFLHQVIKEAVEADKIETQIAVYTHLSSEKAPIQRLLAEFTFGFPKMATDDREINIVESGSMEFDYWGKTIRIEPPLKGAVRARELLSGLVVLIEDENGQPLKLLHLNLPEATPEGVTRGIACEVAEFNQRFYYGVPTSLTEIKDYLDDKNFQQKLDQLLERKLNPAVLPLYARARLRKLLQDPTKTSIIEGLFARSEDKEGCLCLFQFLEGDDLFKAIEIIDYLNKTGRSQLANLITRGSAVVGEFAPGLIEDPDLTKGGYVQLLEDKTKEQLLEIASLDRASLTDYDWEMVAYSQMVLGHIAGAAVALAEGRPLPFTTELNMPSKFIIDLFDFSGRHPQARTIFQTLFDLATAINIAKQEKASYAGGIAKMKSEFYQAYNKQNKMGREAVTTESETDIARAKSLVIYEKESGRLPAKPRVLFIGCGNCQRFEAPLIRELRAEGIEFTEIVGVDLNDFSSQIPSDLNMRFKQGNVANPEFIQEEGEFDIVFIPWSMLNDLVEKRNLLVAMQKFKKLVKKDGIVIFDIPLPIGRNSYIETIEQQADLWKIWGLMERDFEGVRGQRLRSIFDIMHIREMFMHLVHAGFIPTTPNFPLEFDKQQEVCRTISVDDSVLTRNHETGADKNAVKYPFWQTKGYNRVTLGVRNVGEKEVQRLTGLTPSVLVSRAFATL